MTKYLISFPSAAMDIRPEELPAVAAAAHAVDREAKAAGVHVFSGGLDEDIAPILVSGDGSISDDTYPETSELNGGFMILELPSRDAAVEWAAKIAAACRCPQEVRQFQVDHFD